MRAHDPRLYKPFRPHQYTLGKAGGIAVVRSGFDDVRMVTELRMPWWGSYSVGEHPLSPLYTESFNNDDNLLIYCPFCNESHEPDNEDYNSDARQFDCSECEKTFLVTASFGDGFKSSPMPCKNGACHTVFAAQYFHDNKAWFILRCVCCAKGIIDTYRYALLPWLPEYDDPETFDPEGVLKTGADLSVRIETPVLDYLRYKTSYDYEPNVPRSAEHALAKHEEFYGSCEKS